MNTDLIAAIESAFIAAAPAIGADEGYDDFDHPAAADFCRILKNLGDGSLDCFDDFAAARNWMLDQAIDEDLSDIQTHIDRLAPSQVDETVSGNGNREAGHRWFDNSLTLGWYCEGGNVGNPVFWFANRREALDALTKLAALPDGWLDAGGDLSAIVGGERRRWGAE
jgi:hypothetical protein